MEKIHPFFYFEMTGDIDEPSSKYDHRLNGNDKSIFHPKKVDQFPKTYFSSIIPLDLLINI